MHPVIEARKSNVSYFNLTIFKAGPEQCHSRFRVRINNNLLSRKLEGSITEVSEEMDFELVVILDKKKITYRRKPLHPTK